MCCNTCIVLSICNYGYILCGYLHVPALLLWAYFCCVPRNIVQFSGKVFPYCIPVSVYHVHMLHVILIALFALL